MKQDFDGQELSSFFIPNLKKQTIKIVVSYIIEHLKNGFRIFLH